MHAKGGGLYEESMNVPLYISYPEARANNQSAPVVLPYSCSSVDLLPFLYTLALGNAQWRGNPSDMIYYLRGRESIQDPIYQYNHNGTGILQQRRISGIPLHNKVLTGGCQNNGTGCADWQLYQPFVLHTADDFESANIPGNNNAIQPSHAIAFRTVDLTDPNNLYPSMPVSGSGSTAVYSSHEVSNIWICPAATCGGTKPTSFAAHLMYFTSAAHPTISPQNLSAGCIVISTASGPPNGLAWSTATPPTSCSGDLPSGSNYAWFSDLNALTGNSGGPTGSCVSWGEPAIMVTDAFSPGPATMYLAVACFDQSVHGTYYVFSTTNLSLTWTNGCTSAGCFRQEWTLIGSFSASDLPSLDGVPGYPPPSEYIPDSITEFDWSLRPGPGGTTTVVAVLTPQDIPNAPQQLGCIAVNFTMPNGTTITNPLQGSSILANVTDSYPVDTNLWKGQSPGACTYEPASTIGITLVRGLVEQNSSEGGPATPSQKEYLIVASGATP